MESLIWDSSVLNLLVLLFLLFNILFECLYCFAGRHVFEDCFGLILIIIPLIFALEPDTRPLVWQVVTPGRPAGKVKPQPTPRAWVHWRLFYSLVLFPWAATALPTKTLPAGPQSDSKCKTGSLSWASLLVVLFRFSGAGRAYQWHILIPFETKIHVNGLS